MTSSSLFTPAEVVGSKLKSDRVLHFNKSRASVNLIEEKIE